MKSISILDYLVVVAKHRQFVVRFILGVILLSAVILFLVMPRWYKSTSVVMPPKQKNLFTLSASLARSASPLRALGLGATSDDISQFQTILASRRVMEGVVQKFDLMNVYDLETMEKAIKELEGNVSVGLGKEDVSVEIAVYDTSPQRAADMANYFVELLNKVYLEMSVMEARGNREFLGNRYEQNIKDLKQAQENYRKFQQKYGAYSIPEQVKAAIEVAATLQAQIALREVELGILKSTTTPDNETRKSKELELRELRRQMGNLIHGPSLKGGDVQVFPPFDKAPEIGEQYLNYYRDLEIQGKILELLVPLYEQAKIEEQRNTPSVLVLDVAVPAVKASKPKRLILMIVITLASLVVGFFLAVWRENYEQKRRTVADADAEKIRFIRRELHWRKLLKLK